MKRKLTLGALVLGLTALVGCPVNNAAQPQIQPGTVTVRETINIPIDCKQVINAGITLGKWHHKEYIVGIDSEGNVKMWHHNMYEDTIWTVREYVQAQNGVSGIYSATQIERAE